jgi:hypothetical protein
MQWAIKARISSRPVACVGRLKAHQPFLVCYYDAIKDSCRSDTITELPFGFQYGNEPKMARRFRIKYVIQAASPFLYFSNHSHLFRYFSC